MGKGEAVGRAAETPLVMLNAPLVAQRLGYAELSGLDVLELFAFVHPARFVVPTAKGLAGVLDLPVPASDQGVPLLLLAATRKLLATLTDARWPEREGAWDSAQALMRVRWPWANLVLRHLNKPEKPERWLFSRLPEWEEAPLRTPPRVVTLNPEAVQAQLASLVGGEAETRQGQRDFAQAAAHIFRAARAQGRTQYGLGRGWHGHRQDLGLSRARLALGQHSRWRGVDFDLYQGVAAPIGARGEADLSR